MGEMPMVDQPFMSVASEGVVALAIVSPGGLILKRARSASGTGAGWVVGAPRPEGGWCDTSLTSQTGVVTTSRLQSTAVLSCAEARIGLLRLP
jgi:hypothetical protein